MDLTLENTGSGYARFRLRAMAEAAGLLAPKMRVRYLLSKVKKAERTAAMHSRCLLDRKIDLAQNLAERIRQMGALDTDADILHAWETTDGCFEDRIAAFLQQLSFFSSHQELAAHMKSCELKALLHELSTADRQLQQSRDQVHILDYSLKSLKSLARYQARARDNQNVRQNRLAALIKRLRYSFPHIDWPHCLVAPEEPHSH